MNQQRPDAAVLLQSCRPSRHQPLASQQVSESMMLSEMMLRWNLYKSDGGQSQNSQLPWQTKNTVSKTKAKEDAIQLVYCTTPGGITIFTNRKKQTAKDWQGNKYLRQIPRTTIGYELRVNEQWKAPRKYNFFKKVKY